jgi:hypothetical protein
VRRPWEWQNAMKSSSRLKIICASRAREMRERGKKSKANREKTFRVWMKREVKFHLFPRSFLQPAKKKHTTQHKGNRKEASCVVT